MGNTNQPAKSARSTSAATSSGTTTLRKDWTTKTLTEKLLSPAVSLFVDLPYFLFTLVAYETLLKLDDAEITETTETSKEQEKAWNDILNNVHCSSSSEVQQQQQGGNTTTNVVAKELPMEHLQHVDEKPNKPKTTMEEPLHSAWRKVPMLYLDNENDKKATAALNGTNAMTKKPETNEENVHKKHRGRVIWFDRKRGFGFIHPHNEAIKKIYVHQTALQANGYHYLFRGE